MFFVGVLLMCTFCTINRAKLYMDARKERVTYLDDNIRINYTIVGNNLVINTSSHITLMQAALFSYKTELPVYYSDLLVERAGDSSRRELEFVVVINRDVKSNPPYDE